MTTYLRLRRLFRTLTLTSLAASGASCGGTDLPYNPADFTLDLCSPTHTYDALTDVTPATPLDYVALRQIATFATDPAETVAISAEGTPCLSSTDMTACNDALAALDALPHDGWSGAPYGFEVPTNTQLVYTRGDEVAAIRTHAELAAFLGSIDSANEAALLAIYGEDAVAMHRVDCASPQARAVDGGFEVLLRSGIACGPDTHVDETRFFVATDGTVTVLGTRIVERGDPGCVIGRLTDGVCVRRVERATSLGARLAEMASLEAAAIVAFERLARELEAFGAPRELVLRAKRSALDETRHATRVASIAVELGGVVSPIAIVPATERDLLALAIENAVEGTVRETYGAALATYQAEVARDPRLARLFRDIAVDETHHAALSLDLARWLDTQLSDAERATVRAARDAAAEALHEELGVAIDACERDAMGLPDPTMARALFDATFPAVFA